MAESMVDDPGGWLAALTPRVQSALGGAVLHSEIERGELTLGVQPGALLATMTWLRDDAGTLFRQLIDITAVDYPDRELRFEVVYHLLSMHQNQRVRIKVR